MKLHHLQYLVAVAEQGSVRAAAVTLGVSATAVSRALIELENAAGLALLERQAQGIELTAGGQALLVHARLALGQIDAATRTLAALRGQGRARLSIGVTPWVGQSILGPALEAFRRLRPDVQLDISEVLGTGYRPLRDGSVDVAIGLAPLPDTAAEFNEKRLFSYGSAVLCRHGHACGGARRIEELRGRDWLLSRDVDQFPAPLERLFTGDPGDTRAHVHFARSALVALALVRASDLLTICPWPLVEADWARGSVQALHLVDELPMHTTSLLTRRNSAASGVVREFIDCFVATIATARAAPDPVLRRVFATLEPPLAPSVQGSTPDAGAPASGPESG
ncbi:MAG: LysR family transcriptional regulator [Proteobacteria bacterium]|nr:LysR family transcriptional regulator [Pseudomonadota bacterium]